MERTRWKADPMKTVVLDVRTPAEYFWVGHAPMAYNVPFAFWQSDVFPKGGKPVMKPNPDFIRRVKKVVSPEETLLVMCRSGERGAKAGAGVFDRIHGLVTECCLQGIFGVQAGELARVAIDPVALRDRLAIDLEHGNAPKGSGGLTVSPLGEDDAIVLEIDATDRKRDPGHLPATTVKVEVTQLQLGHAQRIAERHGAVTCAVLTPA